MKAGGILLAGLPSLLGILTVWWAQSHALVPEPWIVLTVSLLTLLLMGITHHLIPHSVKPDRMQRAFIGLTLLFFFLVGATRALTTPTEPQGFNTHSTTTSPLSSTQKDSLLQHLDTPTRGLLKAMIWGDRSDLDSVKKTRYAQVGASHVLALSGMHLGILLTIIWGLFTHLVGAPRKSWQVLLPVIAALWLYVWLAGAPISLVRATTMCTIYCLSTMTGRRTSGMNALFVTATLMMWWDPNTLRSISFQLSFTAVLFILLLGQNPFRHRKRHEEDTIPLYIRMMDLCTGSIWVCLVAQIGVAPLVAYHFHQFPIYFLYANMVVLPVATLLMSGGLLLMSLQGLALCTLQVPLLGWVGTLSEGGASLTGQILSTLNALQTKAMDTIASWPMPVIPLTITAYDILSYYLIVAALVIATRRLWHARRERNYES